jgi:Mn-dependent DtxR family transcriptional regulator
MKKIRESSEDYLENIYILKQKNGFVRSVDLATAMNFSKPSISRAVHLLKDKGLLKIVSGGGLELTEAGEKIARAIYERHVFLTKHLMSLGVPEEVAAADACRLEHVLSEVSYRKIKEHAAHCDCSDLTHMSEKIFDFNKSALAQEETETDG